MATNKERIENLEAGLGGLQTSLSRMETGVSDKLHQLEDAISKISEVLLSNRAAFASNNSEINTNSPNGRSRNIREESRDNSEGRRQLFSSKLAKLEFPRPNGEANQWWQWLRRSYKEEGKEVTWEIFQEELWARFGPTECEDFDEALSKVQQVFADELLMHKSLREYFMLIDSASSTSEKLFTCHFGQGDIGSVPEVIAAHFIIYVSNENLHNKLLWQHEKDFRVCEMSLTASLSLLLNPIILSAPKIFQAYLILLVSEAIGIRMCSEHKKLDARNMDCYLIAFQKSIILYTRHMSDLQMDGHPIDDSWDSFWKSISIRTKSDLVDASIAYEGRSPQDMYLLASILKLMSSSMLQITWCLRRCSRSGCLKTLEDVVLYKENNFLGHLVGCFREFNIHRPIQKFVFDILKTYPMRHEESKWMLLQFSGLLSLSHGSGLDFLAKDCIFMIMSLLNLFVFEEGDLDSLSSLFISRSRDVEALVNQKSSKTIALKFQKMQTLHLSKRLGNSENNGKSDIYGEGEIGKGCNGEIFLKCVLIGSEKSSDLDDLADFIECKQSKDYSVWLKDREKFRMWKTQRLAVVRWEKHKWKPKLKRK
ncbi:hypothetical protein EZV62_022594 [Acer yangbiense]|uniref:DUF7812 domain-containing protein n=1 Tax=Acer yangbiense TaxID=1000413 RepID=A0A5C7HAA3_9ROSI|nr:hypothetical protein EZV62_022594 [Acer yangbiense]